MILLPKRYC